MQLRLVLWRFLKATEQPTDTSTGTGKAFFDMLGVFAEFETNLRRVRQLEGVGKPRKTASTRALPQRSTALQYAKMLAEGMGATKIALELKINRDSVYRIAKEMRAA